MKDGNHKETKIRKNKYSFLKNLNKINNIKKILIFYLLLSLKYLEISFEQYISSPKISIFLPIYNKAKYLKRSISSIQKQTLKDIEIIAVNDCSEDHTLEILKKMAKNDTRIKIVNNNNNRGLLFSRAMGIINSNGKYLMNLDPDDKLESNEVLEILYNKASQTKVNIISFGLLKDNNFTLTKIIYCNNFDRILYQPNIFNYGNKLGDYLITNKLIKRSVFLKAYKKFKKKIFGGKWNYGEDEIWSTLVNKYANSMICIDKAIFIYYSNKDSLMNNRFNALYCLNLVYWLEMFIKIFNNKKTKKYLKKQISILLYLFKNNKRILRTIKNNIKIKNKYIKVFKNIIINYNIFKVPINNIIYFLK